MLNMLDPFVSAEGPQNTITISIVDKVIMMYVWQTVHQPLERIIWIGIFHLTMTGRYVDQN